MNNDLVLKIENLNKKFCRNLRDSMLYGMTDTMRSMTGLAVRPEKLRRSEFWALENINLELKKGEALGIIGTNGSGKSTLLRLITGIFPPDTGKIEIRGRIGALIAVGAGFHPHMTGSENVYLNGTILGMTKKELDSKFDEIVDFADIGDFLDAPVATYSSGMKVRLGFAIAIHCEIDIVLIDEILAVGDSAFQAKCMTRLSQFLKNKAVIVVSHSMYQVESLCTKVLWLENGKVKKYGDTEPIIKEYLDFQEEKAIREAEKYKSELISDVFDVNRGFSESQKLKLKRQPKGADYLMSVDKVEFLNSQKEVVTEIPFLSEVTVRVKYTAFVDIKAPHFNFRFDYKGKGVFENSMLIDGAIAKEIKAGEGVLECKIPELPLTPKQYGIVIFIRDNTGVVDLVAARTYARIKILMDGIEKIPSSGAYSTGHIRHEGNFVYVPHTWTITQGNETQSLISEVKQ